jgi:hydrogenase maturation protein HypF
MRIPTAIREKNAAIRLDPRSIWPALLSDLAAGVPAPVIAARFHQGLAGGIVEMVRKIAEHRAFDTVALSGGACKRGIACRNLVSVAGAGR